MKNNLKDGVYGQLTLYKKVLVYMVIGVMLGALAMTIVHSDNLKKYLLSLSF